MKAILNPCKSTGEMPKVRENRRSRQKIYDSVRKELQDEITVLDRSWKNANFPDLAAREDGWIRDT